MHSPYSKHARQVAWLLALVYFASYLMRKNFETMNDAVLTDLAVSKALLSCVVVGMAISYGVGQVLCGVFGDRISPIRMITAGLLLAFGCNVAMAFCPTVPAMCAVWCVNGLAHSMMWPPITRLLVMVLNEREYAYAATRVSWGSSFATVFLYLFCSAMLRITGWRVTLLCCAAGGLAITMFWAAINRRLFDAALFAAPAEKTAVAKTALPRYTWAAVGLIMLAIVAQGMLRDGVSGWMPTFLRESFALSSEDSILITVAQALLPVVSVSAFGWMQQHWIRNETTCSAVIFGVGAATAGALWLLQGQQGIFAVALSVTLMSVLIACMHGINLILIGFVPLHFKKSGRVAAFSGLLNACTYVGTAAGYFLSALLAADGGWGSTVLSWGATALAGAALCLVTAPLWRRFCHEENKNQNGGALS